MQTFDELRCQELRKRIFITGYRGGMAHLASCYSSLEMIYTLYKYILRLNPQNPKWEDRDRFILSKGHAGLALYSVLMERGLMDEATFQSYLQEYALIGGEPCMRDCPWVEASTGSLGHGLPMAVGMALSLKKDGSDAKVYVMLGDGECQEGSVWEAAMMASAQHLGNLIVILDCNRIQKMDFVERTLEEPNWRAKWESFGFVVDEVDGHDITAFKQVIREAAFKGAVPPATMEEGKDTGAMAISAGKPRLILAHTVKGKGVSLMENNPSWHFKLPNKKELKVFKEELGITDAEWE